MKRFFLMVKRFFQVVDIPATVSVLTLIIVLIMIVAVMLVSAATSVSVVSRDVPDYIKSYIKKMSGYTYIQNGIQSFPFGKKPVKIKIFCGQDQTDLEEANRENFEEVIKVWETSTGDHVDLKCDNEENTDQRFHKYRQSFEERNSDIDIYQIDVHGFLRSVSIFFLLG